ncbi:hypothetical protein [Mucilaginibacter sp. R-33]|uniref:hypothetical protein n=1 Tax=Mucilaginibacter sp. R-33 TaxID=3416711 RepID=UPI003CEB051D
MMKKELVHSFKVFITTVVIGAVLTGIATIFNDPEIYQVSDILIGFVYMVPVSAILFIPSWLLFAFVLRRFTKRRISPIYIKIILSLLSVFFIILTLSILNYHFVFGRNYWPSVFPMFIGYYLALIISILVYKIKSGIEVSEDSLMSQECDTVIKTQ